MKKVAKLVTVTFVTRVIVDENASDENIFEAARPELKRKAAEEMFENLEDIRNDVECPYKPVFDVTYFNTDGSVIDSTQIDEESEELAWELFKEFGHTKEEGMYLEFEEGVED